MKLAMALMLFLYQSLVFFMAAVSMAVCAMLELPNLIPFFMPSLGERASDLVFFLSYSFFFAAALALPLSVSSMAAAL